MGLTLEHGRDLLALGSVERRRRHPSAALAAWRRAAAVFEKCAALPWLTQADVELDRLGHRTGAAASGTASGVARLLTPTEHRVAALVADGATNREVAAQMFLALKTVESTLTRVYRKVGVRSRSELARLVHTAPGAAPGAAPDGSARAVRNA
ncbi:LuxR family transcriptional regulator [Streptomyces armeniacus]|uniref:LuxR family transcriptional regulator n=1 Tax=Streptomyces armeniacus TaxID=83291 RepID=A0A345Y0Y4_9ACTN|nr:LuxR family transcriptional regulator [Streptomyces armeniacus]